MATGCLSARHSMPGLWARGSGPDALAAGEAMTVDLEISLRLSPETVDDGPVSTLTLKVRASVLGVVDPSSSRPPGPSMIRFADKPSSTAKTLYLAHTKSPDPIPAAWFHADEDSAANSPLTQAGAEVYVDSAKPLVDAILR